MDVTAVVVVRDGAIVHVYRDERADVSRLVLGLDFEGVRPTLRFVKVAGLVTVLKCAPSRLARKTSPDEGVTVSVPLNVKLAVVAVVCAGGLKAIATVGGVVSTVTLLEDNTVLSPVFTVRVLDPAGTLYTVYDDVPAGTVAMGLPLR